MHADPALIRSTKGRVSADEWQARTDLAAAYRVVAMYGWDDLVFTHISARVPGPEHHFLINPYGMMFEEITASSLVKVNLAGEKAMESPFEINPAGCWNWFGYSYDDYYPLKGGVQVTAIHNMIRHVMGEG